MTLGILHRMSLFFTYVSTTVVLQVTLLKIIFLSLLKFQVVYHVLPYNSSVLSFPVTLYEDCIIIQFTRSMFLDTFNTDKTFPIFSYTYIYIHIYYDLPLSGLTIVSIRILSL